MHNSIIWKIINIADNIFLSSTRGWWTWSRLSALYVKNNATDKKFNRATVFPSSRSRAVRGSELPLLRLTYQPKRTYPRDRFLIKRTALTSIMLHASYYTVAILINTKHCCCCARFCIVCGCCCEDSSLHTKGKAAEAI